MRMGLGGWISLSLIIPDTVGPLSNSAKFSVYRCFSANRYLILKKIMQLTIRPTFWYFRPQQIKDWRSFKAASFHMPWFSLSGAGQCKSWSHLPLSYHFTSHSTVFPLLSQRILRAWAFWTSFFFLITEVIYYHQTHTILTSRLFISGVYQSTNSNVTFWKYKKN